MIRHRAAWLAITTLFAAACSTDPDESTKTTDDGGTLEDLQQRTGAPVRLELGDAGTARVLAMTPRHPLSTDLTDPGDAATAFLADYHKVFDLDARDASDFVVSRVDVDARRALRHVTLQRTYDGIPVFQGALTVHMDDRNAVFRVLGDESYSIAPPINHRSLGAADAAIAAGKALGLPELILRPVSTEGLRTTFHAPGTLDPITVEPRIYHVKRGEDRHAYQATISWLDDHRQQQYQLVLVDAQDGSKLEAFSLVNTFRGRVFTQSPGVGATTDTRVLVSFDGNPAASPQGWIDSTRRTRGNNAIAATDLNANNSVGTNEVQPTANAAGDFDFPFSPLQDSASFRDAAVTSAFFLVNDWHDRTYALGFTEAAGNFQTNNFGLGGAGNDEVQVDAQDGSGTNNANFATPPDGVRPRMQMFLFTITGGPKEDGDFDPGVIYHEATHGLSNRLVGGGSTSCLNGIQSGGMGEGWGDFIAASFTGDPVAGAYVTGNAATGVRRASMADSPFTYANIKDRTMTEVHDAGEIWAATLFDVRKELGAAITEQLVVTGMKLTPCNPTMLQARDAIIQADAQLNGGANRCALFTAFAGRQMGTGARSNTHNSTTSITLSTAVPPECDGGGGGGETRSFTSTDVPKSIPDNNQTGVSSAIDVPAGLDLQEVKVDVGITHTFRGDLIISVIAPNGQTAVLSNRQGGSADNFNVTGLDITSAFTPGASASGQWRLLVRDVARVDVGTINSFKLTITSSQ